MISAGIVKELREITGAGMMDCKKALTETNGDIEKAIDYLKEKGITKAAKKSSRIAAEGLVATYAKEDGKVVAAIEVNAETDFVSKNEEFKTFVNKLAQIVAEKNPADLDALSALEYENGVTVAEELTNKIATIGENMNIRRFARIETEGVAGAYLHGDGKIAVLAELTAGDVETAEDICMQVAALNAEFLNEAAVPAERVAREKEIIKKQTMAEGKPEEIAEKIAEGRLRKFLEEITLVNQSFVKDSSISVKDYVASKGGEVVQYVRFEKGEGLEKKVENFAEEVMSQLK